MASDVSPQEAMAFACACGWEEALAAEVRELRPGVSVEVRGPGLVWIALPTWRGEWPVFAREFLPDIRPVTGRSVRELAQALGETLDPVLDLAPRPWAFRLVTPGFFTSEEDVNDDLHGRAGLVVAAFAERMQTYRRRAWERVIKLEDLPKRKDGLLVQAFLVARERLWISVNTQPVRARGQGLPFFAGAAGLADDPKAPSRSYFKVEEAFREVGEEPRPGQTCVDLGAAPGGWTWAALKRGARVIAVDAADLDPQVVGHPGCTHLRDNGYAYLPDRPVDWLFCDMVVRPLATLGLLERWLTAGACHGFVVNVKFRGKEPGSILAAIRELATKFGLDGLRVRHLYHDRNEITLILPPGGSGQTPSASRPKKRRQPDGAP